MPENSVLTHDFVVSIHRDGGYQGGYGWKGKDVFYTFLRLRNAADIDKVNDYIQRVIEKYTPAQYDAWKMITKRILAIRLNYTFSTRK